MKVVKYPKWKKKCQCKVCGTEFIITSKDVASHKVSVVGGYSTHHRAVPHCPFCDERLDVDIEEFYEKGDANE